VVSWTVFIESRDSTVANKNAIALADTLNRRNAYDTRE